MEIEVKRILFRRVFSLGIKVGRYFFCRKDLILFLFGGYYDNRYGVIDFNNVGVREIY